MSRTIFEQLTSLNFIYSEADKEEDREALLASSVRLRQILQFENLLQLNKEEQSLLFSYLNETFLKDKTENIIALRQSFRGNFEGVAKKYMSETALEKDTRARRWYRCEFGPYHVENMHDLSLALYGKLGKFLYTLFYSVPSQFTHGFIAYPNPLFAHPLLSLTFRTDVLLYLWKWTINHLSQEQSFNLTLKLQKAEEPLSFLLLNSPMLLENMKLTLEGQFASLHRLLKEKNIDVSGILLRPLYHGLCSYYRLMQCPLAQRELFLLEEVANLINVCKKLSPQFITPILEEQLLLYMKQERAQLAKYSKSPYTPPHLCATKNAKDRLPKKGIWCHQLADQYLSVNAHGIAFPYVYKLDEERLDKVRLYEADWLFVLEKELLDLLKDNLQLIQLEMKA